MAEYSALCELMSALDTAQFRARQGAISFRQFVVFTVQGKERDAGNALHVGSPTTAAMPQWPDRGESNRRASHAGAAHPLYRAHEPSDARGRCDTNAMATDAADLENDREARSAPLAVVGACASSTAAGTR
jgi:hypothetical protein